jgi:hypothetical protein
MGVSERHSTQWPWAPVAAVSQLGVAGKREHCASAVHSPQEPPALHTGWVVSHRLRLVPEHCLQEPSPWQAGRAPLTVQSASLPQAPQEPPEHTGVVANLPSHWALLEQTPQALPLQMGFGLEQSLLPRHSTQAPDVFKQKGSPVWPLQALLPTKLLHDWQVLLVPQPGVVALVHSALAMAAVVPVQATQAPTAAVPTSPVRWQ